MSTNLPAQGETKKPAPGPIKVSYTNREIYLWGLSHTLGSLRRDLAQLKSEQLICNEPAALAAMGYLHNHSAAPGESQMTIASGTFTRLLEKEPNPAALVFHHSYPDSTFLPGDGSESGFMSRVHYFASGLMEQFKMDHVPYLVSFGSGCTGMLSMLLTAAGISGGNQTRPVLCLTADTKPPGTTYDALREKILSTDCSSGFLVGSEKRGYRVLGITYYSTTRKVVPLVEIVKRSVQMIRELAKEVDADLTSGNVVIHYPNIFTTAWDMVTNYLQLPKESHIVDGLAERAHCLSSDSMISLAKFHSAKEGRLHIVLNFGSGIHLGACILREEALP
jgi:hypothetical protein